MNRSMSASADRVSSRTELKTFVFLSLFFENRIMAHIHLSWLDPHKVRKTTIVGANKMVVFDDSEASENSRIYNNHAELPSDLQLWD